MANSNLVNTIIINTFSGIVYDLLKICRCRYGKMCYSVAAIVLNVKEEKGMCALSSPGNTCRSPIAEAVFRKYIQENNLEQFWEVDSAALFGYHEGKNINAKSMKVLEENGIIDYNHIARTIKREDFYMFDWILGMDYYNLNLLSRMQPEGTLAEIDLLGHYHPEGQIEIEDPYCDQQAHRFQTIYSQCLRCVPMFIEKCK